MKSYLKKLGSRKFQAFLLITIVNITSACLTWTGSVDVAAQVDGYMPLINLVVQLVTTGVYTLVEGKVDKARALSSTDTTNPENYYR